MKIENQIVNRTAIGVPPFLYVVAHSTGNANSTAQNEADYVNRAWQTSQAYYTHVVGNGRIIQVNATGQGSWNIGNFDTNVNTFAAVELIESHKTQEEFNIDYKLYVELLRNLAKQAGLPVRLDAGHVPGIVTHNYASANGWGSDHTDPINYLAKWGISYEQFKKDIVDGVGGNKQVEAKETVYEKHGRWFTDKKFTKLANGVIAHMGKYWAFENGVLIKSRFVSQWNLLYWSTDTGEIASGTGEYAGMKFDFGTDNTYNVKGITIKDAAKAGMALNSVAFK